MLLGFTVVQPNLLLSSSTIFQQLSIDIILSQKSETGGTSPPLIQLISNKNEPNEKSDRLIIDNERVFVGWVEFTKPNINPKC